jgi:quercetin dioxygenase-like cupin family protein
MKAIHMEQEYIVIPDLVEMVGTIQPQSIVSRTFYRGEDVKAVLFGFDAGLELSEHTSTQSAVIQIVQGDATITLGEQLYELSAGSWLHMPPGLKHSVLAKTPLIMLLSMFRSD